MNGNLYYNNVILMYYLSIYLSVLIFIYIKDYNIRKILNNKIFLDKNAEKEFELIQITYIYNYYYYLLLLIYKEPHFNNIKYKIFPKNYFILNF